MQQIELDLKCYFYKQDSEIDLPPLAEVLNLSEKEKQILLDDETFERCTLFIHYQNDQSKNEQVSCLFCKTDITVKELKDIILDRLIKKQLKQENYLLQHGGFACLYEEQNIKSYSIFNNSHVDLIEMHLTTVEQNEKQHLYIDYQDGPFRSKRTFIYNEAIKKLHYLIYSFGYYIDKNKAVFDIQIDDCYARNFFKYDSYQFQHEIKPNSTLKVRVRWIGGGPQQKTIFVNFENKSVKISIDEKGDYQIVNIKEMIFNQIGIPVDEQELIYYGQSLSNYKLLSYYNIGNGDIANINKIINNFWCTLYVIQNREKDKINFKIITAQKICHIKGIIGKIIQTMSESLSNKEQCGLFLLRDRIFYSKKKQFLFIYIYYQKSNTVNYNEILYIEEEEKDCLQFSYKIKNLNISNLSALKQSLSRVDHIDKFIDLNLKEINTNLVNKSIYQQFELVHIIAIRLWTSNLLHTQCNIALRAKQYSQWIEYLKCLLDAVRNCKYFRGNAFRGIRNYQDLKIYSQNQYVQWSEVSCISKNKKWLRDFAIIMELCLNSNQ